MLRIGKVQLSFDDSYDGDYQQSVRPLDSRLVGWVRQNTTSEHCLDKLGFIAEAGQPAIILEVVTDGDRIKSTLRRIK